MKKSEEAKRWRYTEAGWLLRGKQMIINLTKIKTKINLKFFSKSSAIVLEIDSMTLFRKL